MIKTKYGYIPDGYYIGSKNHPVCSFFELFQGTSDPDDNYYCLPLCHMVYDGKPAEICKGDYLKCPIRKEVTAFWKSKDEKSKWSSVACTCIKCDPNSWEKFYQEEEE